MTQPQAKRESLRNIVGALAMTGVIFGAAAVVAPGIEEPAGRDAARAEALAGANRIAAALRDCLSDCEMALRVKLPAGTMRLYGPGVKAGGDAFATSQGYPISGILTHDEIGIGETWKGPYADAIEIDPWGRPFVANIAALKDGSAFFILSAGEDGVFQTGPQDDAIRADDVGVVLLR